EGKDPRVEQERRRQAELRRQANTFASVCEDYFADMKRRGLRRATEVERDIRREFLPLWGKRPITDISRYDVLAVIDPAVNRGAPPQAHHIHSCASRLFGWAIDRGVYGLETSPTDRMRPAKIIGAKQPRTRVLTDDELRALWHASGKLGYPFGPLCALLVLTGQRRAEVTGARWGEIDLKRKVWSIPATRMKAGAAHLVPLVDDTIAVLASLPRFHRGDYLFTTTFGARPVSGFSKMKKRLDQAMAVDAPFTLHDIR